MTSILQTKTRHSCNPAIKLFVAAALSLTVVCLTASAGASVTGGLRAGITDDPDSGFLGGHLAIYPGGIPLRIEPSLELGFGDYGPYDYFTLRLTGNFKYMFKPGRRHPIYLYPIFGLSMYYFNLEDCEGDCSETEMGINIGMGVQLWGFMFDLSFGAGGEPYPDFTFTFGYTF